MGGWTTHHTEGVPEERQSRKIVSLRGRNEAQLKPGQAHRGRYYSNITKRGETLAPSSGWPDFQVQRI